MQSENETRVVNIIDFHGAVMWVVENQGVEYIYAKPLAEMAGIDWRRARKTLFEEDNAVLYGSSLLKHPIFAPTGGPRSPQDDGIYIRLDRSRMYLARIQTNQMKAQGKVEAAETLLKLQIEWAEAIHNYETHGVALKNSAKDARAQLVSLIKAQASSKDSEVRDSINRMVRDICAELGYPIADPQQQLPLS